MTCLWTSFRNGLSDNTFRDFGRTSNPDLPLDKLLLVWREDNNKVVDTFAFLESPVSKVIHSKGTEKFGKEEIPLDGRF
jgi:hypothetical protein